LPGGRRHYRLTLADALDAHHRALGTGGRPGIPNLHLVQSAIDRPYNGYYRPIAHKAAALVHSTATNHGFADGNKRTALILLHTLLIRSGYQLVPAQGDRSLDQAAEDMLIAVVTHELSFDGLVDWLKRRLERLP